MLGNPDPDTGQVYCLVFFFWYALMEDNCGSGARPSKVQNQYTCHGRYEEFINKFLYTFPAGVSALVGAQVLQEHYSM